MVDLWALLYSPDSRCQDFEWNSRGACSRLSGLPVDCTAFPSLELCGDDPYRDVPRTSARPHPVWEKIIEELAALVRSQVAKESEA